MARVGMSEELVRMEAEIGVLRAQMARQEVELTRLRGAARPTSRRQMLMQIGMAAVGVAAMGVAAGTGEDAVDAADGGNLVLGTTNNAESQTAVILDGTSNPLQVFLGAGGPAVLGAFRAAIAAAAVTTNNPVGVYGFTEETVANSFGVVGNNGANGTGVYGTSSNVGGTSTGTGVGGNVTGTGVGVYGNNGGSGPGMQGQSIGGHGLVGTTFATDGQHAALIGSVQQGGNAIGLRGSIPPGATGLAGVFDGDVTINGALRVFGSPKNAAVKHPGDNTYRLLYCEEAPESWFADYGEGTLAGDKAEITFDPDFAALVHTDAYHVFLTAYGPQQLYVAQRSATGFTVVAIAGATQAGGPKAATGSGTFSWRVVAKRKDIAGERLAKVDPPPPLKAPAVIKVPSLPHRSTVKGSND